MVKDSIGGASECKKRYYKSNKLIRMPKTIEHSVFGIGECLSTNVADITPFFETVNIYIFETQLFHLQDSLDCGKILYRGP